MDFQIMYKDGDNVVLTLDDSVYNWYPFDQHPWVVWGPSKNNHIKTFIYSKKHPLACVSLFQITARRQYKHITYEKKDGTVQKARLTIPARILTDVYLESTHIKK
jgi:hypothetical protein